MRIKAIAARSVVVGLVASGLAVSWAGSAEAVGGNCSSVRQEKEDWGWNSFRVRARCSSLHANSKAQGVLIKRFSKDPETAWFTQLNTYKYSAYTTCTAVATCPSMRMKIERV